MGERFPLLILPIGAYNLVAILAWLAGLFTHSLPFDVGKQVLFSLPMPAAQSHWIVSLGDIFILGGLICLFFEVLKSTDSRDAILLNHALSMVVLIIGLVEFLLLSQFATSTFFLLVVMTFLDVLAGFIVTVVAARKDIGFGA
jgi:hypothetical protein